MEMIRAEWLRRRAALGVTTAAYLAVPLLPALAIGPAGKAPLESITLTSSFLSLGVMVAAAVWGSGAWAPERKGRWVYFLSLPVDRVRLFALRYLAGLAWLALPVAALAVAARAAAAAAAPHLPPEFHAYPGPLAAWAALASWLLYTAGFVAAARWERPGRVALVPAAALVLVFAVAVMGMADGVTGPLMEELIFGSYTPLPVLSAPNLFDY